MQVPELFTKVKRMLIGTVVVELGIEGYLLFRIVLGVLVGFLDVIQHSLAVHLVNCAGQAMVVGTVCRCSLNSQKKGKLLYTIPSAPTLSL